VTVALGAVLLVVGIAMCVGFVTGLTRLFSGRIDLFGPSTLPDGLAIVRAFCLILGVTLLWFVGCAIGLSGLLLVLGV
jgi:hypothetical protein